jgi:hypothetical protein
MIEDVLAKELSSKASRISLLLILCSQRIRSTSNVKRVVKKWYRLKHSDVGGVSTSQWLVGLNYSLQSKKRILPDKTWIEKLNTFGLKRAFVDITKCTIGGIPTKAPLKPLPTLIHVRSALNDTFTLPSVKSFSGWVRRGLTFLEIANVLDLSELMVKQFEEDGVSQSCVVSSDMPPLKVIHAIKILLVSIVHSEQEEVTAASSIPVIPVQEAIVEPDNAELDKSLLKMQPAESMNQDDIAAVYLKAYGEKAAKKDGARIPVELWDGHLFRHYFPSLQYDYLIHGRALEVLREKFLFRMMLLSSLRSFANYLTTQYGTSWLGFYLTHRKTYRLGKSRKRKREARVVGDVVATRKFHALKHDMNKGFEALIRLSCSTSWEWKDGSSLLYWRWASDIRESARDGLPLFINKKLPRWTRKQRLPKESFMVEKMESKFKKVMDMRYVEDGTVVSMINCFAVAKGEDDIRLVYDGTKSGLNDCLWAPNFFLPSVDSMLMNVDAQTWCADLDLTDMFLNYPLHKSLIAYSGVDYTAILKSETTIWKRWLRMFMGLKSSPYVTCKMFGWTIDVILGDRWDQLNPFRWDSVIANLPGMQSYDPSKPRISKMCEGSIAAALEAYVDDLRLMGSSELICHAATSRAAKVLQYLGQQNASRKYRPPHVRPGPWCGSFVANHEGSVWVYTSQEKWEKAKSFIIELNSLIQDEGLNEIDF